MSTRPPPDDTQTESTKIGSADPRYRAVITAR